MELSEEDLRIITKALINASNMSETEWLNLEKTIIEGYAASSNENASTIVREMWNQLYQKIEGAIERMKVLEKE